MITVEADWAMVLLAIVTLDLELHVDRYLAGEIQLTAEQKPHVPKYPLDDQTRHFKLFFEFK